MAEQLLDRAQIGAHVEQVRGVAVAHAVRMDAAREAGFERALAQPAARVAVGEPPRRLAGAAPLREEERLREQARRAPRVEVRAQRASRVAAGNGTTRSFPPLPHTRTSPRTRSMSRTSSATISPMRSPAPYISSKSA